MATVKCPDCGKDVSDRANVCIHCGAPLNFNVKNGDVTIKCQNINNGWLKAKVIDAETDEVLLEIAQGSVEKIHIDKDTPVKITYFGFHSTEGVLKYEGSHKYEIKRGNFGLFTAKLLFNEVSVIDSD